MAVNAAAQLRTTYALLSDSKAPEKEKQNDLYADEV